MFRVLAIGLLSLLSVLTAEETGGKGMQIKGIHVLVEVSDLAVSTAYYEKVFGITHAYALDGEVGFVVADGVSFNLQQTEKVKPRAVGTVAVHDIAAEFARLRSVGVTPDGDPRPAPDGHAIVFQVADPDGNILELAE